MDDLGRQDAVTGGNRGKHDSGDGNIRNSFLVINIGETPMTMFTTALADFSIVGIILAVIIPVLGAWTQFISVKLQPQPATDQENPMASSMKMMTYTMPLFSVFLGFTLPAGLGLYWAVSAIVRCVQQLAIATSI